MAAQFDKTARWTQQECDDAFDEDAGLLERQVVALEGSFEAAPVDALVSRAYNVGVGNPKSSRLRRKLNAGKYENPAS